MTSENDNFEYWRGKRGGGLGRGFGRGKCRRGRPPVAYPVGVERNIVGDVGIVELTSFELKIMQLSDLEGLTQQQIAEKLNISQTSVWRYLKNAREKITEALMKYHTIRIKLIE